MRIDLHIHTNASDGAYSPADVVELAHEKGLDIIAITDHDSTEGVEEATAAGRRWGVEVIPGVELSADVPSAEVHIVGYFVDYHDRSLQEVLQRLRTSRVQRAQAMVTKLAQLRMPLDWDRVKAIAGDGAVGRPHIALAMRERGYVANTGEAFNRYLGRNGPAYVERYKLTPADAVALIRRAGGLAALAHPWIAGLENASGPQLDLETLLPALCSAGLKGIETYYSSYSHETVQGLLRVAERFQLIPTGGSDFHGGGVLPEAVLGAVSVPEESLLRLRAQVAQKGS
ncbi:MAG: PHP domain-containing protein [Chloroflexi bacterium]|nr:PHP domain-containing protein [Chloroflexota bacterium]